MATAEHMAYEHTAGQMSGNPEVKYYTVTLGNIGHDLGIEKKLQELTPGLKNVLNWEECDFILVFLHFDSRAETNIEKAVKILNTLSANKQAILVVLHHTFDPESVVPDSSGRVNRENTITVDCLFNEDHGLLQCSKNDIALSKHWFCLEGIPTKPAKQTPNQDTTANQMLHRHKKYFTVVTGNTYVSHHDDLERKFEELIEVLQKVQTLEECDFILFFFHSDSQRGTGIEPALNLLSRIQGNKAAVVVVLHHTSDPNTVVPDSSGAVNRNNTIAVDLLFYKDTGLLTCYKNDEALCKVINWINNMDITNMGPRQSQTDERITNQLSKSHYPKYITLEMGNTLGHKADIERKLHELIPGLQKVQDLEECDFILVFCSVVSRAGTDIEAAVKKLNSLPGNRPTVLVVLHHTFDPESVVPDSSRCVKRENTVTVDCLFHEDQGLLHCFKNDEALSKFINWLHIGGILTWPAKQSQSIFKDELLSKVKNLSSFLRNLNKPPNKHPNKDVSGQDHTANQLLKHYPLSHFSLNTGNTLGHGVDLERKLQELVPGLQKVQNVEECDFILVFCPVVSRAGTDIEAAMKKLNTLSGTKPAALMMLHHTFNPEEIVPDSRMTVKRDHLIAVDCLFYEDQGLLRCNKNNEAYILVSEWIKTQVLPKTKKGNMFDKKENMTNDESRGGHDLLGPAARRRRISDSAQDLLENH